MTPSARGVDRRLVVNGDDFGLAAPVNEGVIRAFDQGILTSTSLMVGAEAADEAVAAARARPGLAVGLHVTLVQGRSVLAADRIRGLVSADRRFREQPVLAGLAYWFSPRLRAAVRAEIGAQLAAFRATGLELSHVDGHLNVHLHPVAARVLCDLAGEFDVRAMRLTREPLLRNLRFDRRHAARKAFERAVFAVLSRLALGRLRRLEGREVAIVDSVYGMHQSGSCDERYVEHVVRSLPAGVHELYCHPATGQTPAMRGAMPGYRPERELAALCSARVAEAVAERGIELVSYATLTERSVRASTAALRSSRRRARA